VTYKIQRSMTADAIVFALSGDMDHDHTERLQELLDLEKHRCLLRDLTDVTLVGRAAVQFLAQVEAAGVRIVNCPDDVRTWIVAEHRGTQPS
jgi:anti-anti-sigma regulatory factor